MEKSISVDVAKSALNCWIAGLNEAKNNLDNEFVNAGVIRFLHRFPLKRFLTCILGLQGWSFDMSGNFIDHYLYQYIYSNVLDYYKSNVDGLLLSVKLLNRVLFVDREYENIIIHWKIFIFRQMIFNHWSKLPMSEDECEMVYRSVRLSIGDGYDDVLKDMFALMSFGSNVIKRLNTKNSLTLNSNDFVNIN